MPKWLMDAVFKDDGTPREETVQTVLACTLPILLSMLALVSNRVRSWLKNALRRVRANFTRSPRRAWAPWTAEDLRLTSRVLFIDDEEMPYIAMMQSRRFAKVARESSITPTLLESLERDFDLLVLDVRGVTDAFGATDGVASLDMIRLENPWIPIVIFTSYPDDIRGNRRSLAKRSSYAIVNKMTSYKEFESQMIEALSGSRTRDYFISRLSDIGCDNPEARLALVDGSDDAVASVGGGVTNSEHPQVADQCSRLLRMAVKVRDGRRWIESERK